ncbi:MAG: NCS2 family permease [Clostridiales Family XIII bacterium]|jgi:AGZA family xanthine/uracil permease-like MFS transporter|nr:NCS2 family permease [Clostridiales Family XIII bacterium]
MESLFRLRENNTTVGREVVAGITTFVTMAYIVFVNPSILGLAGMDTGAVMLATCIGAAIGTFIMGLMSNYPFAQAPGMGLNAFFAFTICGSLGYTWQAGLAAVFISGIIFIIITVTGLREAVVNGIPASLKKAISAGIGVFIAYIGVKNAGLLTFTSDPGTYQMFGDSPESATIVAGAGAVPAFSFASPTAILSIIGLVITVALVTKKLKGALIIGIAITSVIGAILQFASGGAFNVGITPPGKFELPSLAPTFGKFGEGFGQLFTTDQGIGVAIISVVTILISLTLVDMFDTIGTLIGTASKAGFLDKDGNLPRARQAMMADAIATTAGAVIGTSTVTTYVESTAGVSAGGRTGLTSVTTGVLLLLSIFLAPVLGFVPSGATAPILIIVGVMMASSLKDIDWPDWRTSVPCFFTVVFMPFAYSISDGIAMGFIFYVIINAFSGKAKEVSPVMYVFAALFALRYVFLNV